MFEIDHSVVFRRNNDVRGSGTVVHSSPTFIVLEVYERANTVQLNDVFSRIRITHGRSILYDGDGVVCNVMDHSSMQMVTLYLKDRWITFGSKKVEADNRFEVERFLELYSDCDFWDPELGESFFRFTQLLSQMLAGLRGTGRLHGAERSEEMQKALNMMADRLFKQFAEVEQCLENCDDEALIHVAGYFKQHLFPLSIYSRIFRMFHSSNRTSYLNDAMLKNMKMDVSFWKGGMRGILLDLFFLKYAGIDFSEDRSHYFVGTVQEALVAREGKIKILLFGTDSTPIKILEKLPQDSLARIEMQVVTFEEEATREFDKEVSRVIRAKGVDVSFTCEQWDLVSTMRNMFNNLEKGKSEYDLVLSTHAFEPLSGRKLLHLIKYLLERLKVDGEICFFKESEKQSSIRTQWLLWYSRNSIDSEWDRVIPDTVTMTREEHEFGLLISICNHEN